jgi:hypothetical protein
MCLEAPALVTLSHHFIDAEITPHYWTFARDGVSDGPESFPLVMPSFTHILEGMNIRGGGPRVTRLGFLHAHSLRRHPFKLLPNGK